MLKGEGTNKSLSTYKFTVDQSEGTVFNIYQAFGSGGLSYLSFVQSVSEKKREKLRY